MSRSSKLGSSWRATWTRPPFTASSPVYLEPDGDSPPYLAELRLQNMDGLDLTELRRLAAASGKPFQTLVWSCPCLKLLTIA